MKRERVVVFGGSGFLGSHVADTLSDKGYEVTIFDLKSSPYLRDDQEMVVGNTLDERNGVFLEVADLSLHNLADKFRIIIEHK